MSRTLYAMGRAAARLLLPLVQLGDRLMMKSYERDLQSQLDLNEHIIQWGFGADRLEYWFATNLGLHVVPTPKAYDKELGWTRSGMNIRFAHVSTLTEQTEGNQISVLFVVRDPDDGSESTVILTSRSRSEDNVLAVVRSHLS